MTSATGRPSTTTWLESSPPGLSSTGFIARLGLDARRRGLHRLGPADLGAVAR